MQAPAEGWLRVGSKVEVMGEEQGYLGSFCTAQVLSIAPTGEVEVVYDEFLTDDGLEKLHEVFTAESIFRVRPVLPDHAACITSFKQVKAGHTVDVLEDDCWWVGIVTDVFATRLKVMLTDRDDKEVKTVTHLTMARRGFVWVPSEQRWYRRRVTVPYLRSCGVKSKAAQQAVTAMLAEPMLLQDGTPVGADGRPLPAAAAGQGAHTNSSRQKRGRDDDWDGDGDSDSGSGGSDEEGFEGKAVVKEEAEDGEEAVMKVEEEAADAVMGSNAANGELGELGLGGGRGKRAHKARLVYVDGHPVLKENLYDLLTGEPSVFAKELAKGKGAPLAIPGVSYAPPQRPKGGKGPDYLYHGSKRAPGQPAPPAAEGAAGGKDGEEAKAERAEHNQRIKKEKEAADAQRAIYLKHHIDKLKPFLTPEVVKSVLDKAAAASELVAKHLPPEPVQQQPPQINGTLREYQMVGLQWLVKCFDHGINAILADEMGLGKTLQTIAFLAHLLLVRKVSGPNLVVVPLSVLPNWISEFKRWCPKLRVVRLHVNDEGERKRLRKEVLADPSSFDVAVTTYDMVVSEHFGPAIRNLPGSWRYLVLDEGHKVKNDETLVSQAMRKIHCQHILMLTGTPVQNNLRELYSLLNFLYPDLFTDASLFECAFNLQKRQVDDARLEQAHYLLRPFLLRRVKDEVECKLPPRLETRVNCPLTAMQTFWYRRLLLRESFVLTEMEAQVDAPAGAAEDKDNASGSRERSASVQDLTAADVEEEQEAGPSAPAKEGSGGGGGAGNYKRAMNLLMQLRKCCNHPFMFPDAEPDYDGESTSEDLVEGSGKLKVLDLLLKKLQARGHRVVLFSQFTMMLDILEDYLIMRGYKYRRLDGSTNRIQRMMDIEMFNKKNSDVFVYILCTRAGGLGVNLQTADTCILYDSDWNPQWDLQAMARVHRIGQTKPVHVYRLCSEGTVEDRIQRRAEQKLYLDQMVNRGSTAAAEEMEALDKKELLAMLRFGADRIFKNDAGAMPSEEELDSLLDRSSMEWAEGAEGERPQRQRAATPAVQAGEKAGEQAGAAQPGMANGAADRPSASSRDAVQVGDGAEEGARSREEVGAGKGADAEATAGAGGQAVAGGRAELDEQAGTAAGEEAGAGGLQVVKRSALDFSAVDQPVGTFMFGDVDYKELRRLQANSMKDIAAAYKRVRKSRTTQVEVAGVGQVAVLRENNYTMAQGGISVVAGTSRKSAREEALGKRRVQVAGKDFGHMDYCQVCWDGGDLLCCDFCPVSIHPACMGITMADAARAKKWACPHHKCATCGRSTAAAGGLLFRCEICPHAYCEDCLPEEHEMVGECEHFQALGQIHPKQACFILCGPQCQEHRIAMTETINELKSEALRMGHDGVMERAHETERDAAVAAAEMAGGPEAAAAAAAELAAGKGRKSGGGARDRKSGSGKSHKKQKHAPAKTPTKTPAAAATRAPASGTAVRPVTAPANTSLVARRGLGALSSLQGSRAFLTPLPAGTKAAPAEPLRQDAAGEDGTAPAATAAATAAEATEEQVVPGRGAKRGAVELDGATGGDSTAKRRSNPALDAA